MTTTLIAEEFPLLQPGVYGATFDRIEEPPEPGQFGPYFNWFFVASAPDGPVEVMGRSRNPDRFTSSTKARQWYEAILGRVLAKGEAADFQSLRGTRVELTVDVVTTERGDERNRIINIRRTPDAPPASTVGPDADLDYQAFLAQRAATEESLSGPGPSPVGPSPSGEDQ